MLNSTVLDTAHLPSNVIIPSSNTKEPSSKPTGPPSVPEPPLAPYLVKLTNQINEKKVTNQENEEEQEEIEKNGKNEEQQEKENLDLDEALVVNEDVVTGMFVNKVVDEDQDKEALDLGIEDKKMIEALDLGNEDNKMIDKCLDLIQSQFGEEDEGDKESEERVLA
ncbi:hypothetical protein PSHT_06005 [Puccinia striiformis]|uniref:Uncharacterized protein n=1 Tax=Puccinia striiformis TaxID=27350 RepID=A0A2S4W900_9BASI|nr:hypothetical protein PSHT_06005 [Puccinia striiformis]